MPGKAKIMFVGGCLDGEVNESVDTRLVTANITVETASWFRQVGETVQLMKSGKRDKHWINYKVEVYEKQSKNSEGYFVYTYKESKLIERCTEMTQKGGRCMKAASEGGLCMTHKVN